MFSGITNLLFGSSSTTESAEVHVREDSPCGLKTQLTEDEWELVDERSSRPCTPCCSGRSSPVVTSWRSNVQTRSRGHSLSSSQCDSEPRVLGNYLEHGSDTETVLSDVSSVPEMLAHPSMCESWLMTPPPCFTAGGNSPARLQSNPMENLLIEHPSMSVYGTRGRPSSTGHESDPESSSDTDMPVVEEEEDEGELTAARSGRKSVMSHSSGRSRVITAKQQLVAQQRAQKAMQALKKHKDSKKLAKSQIQRSNQVVHAQCGRPLRRKYHMQLRNSGAVNDRKSQ